MIDIRINAVNKDNLDNKNIKKYRMNSYFQPKNFATI